MPLKVVVGGVEKDAESASIIINGVAKDVRRIEAWNSSAWKLVQSFAPPISLSISPATAFGDRDTAPGTSISNYVTATPAGGTAPFTYAWSKVSGDTVTVDSPTLATTRFRQFFSEGGSVSATYQCVVTDSLGLTASDTVSVSLINTGSGS